MASVPKLTQRDIEAREMLEVRYKHFKKKWDNFGIFPELANYMDDESASKIKTESFKDLRDLSDKEVGEILSEARSVSTFYSDVEQNSKRLANGQYGAIGARFFEYYEEVVAADITAEGRNLAYLLDDLCTIAFEKVLPKQHKFFERIKQKYSDIVRVEKSPSVKPFVILDNGKGSNIIYGDTDSVCIAFESLLKGFGIRPERDDPKRITFFISDFVEHFLIPYFNVYMEKYIKKRNGENYYVLECEQILRKMFLYAKKKYAGSLMMLDGKWVGDQMKFKAGGIEIKRGSVPKVLRQYMSDLLKRALSIDAFDSKYFLKYVYALKEDIRKKPISVLCDTKVCSSFDKYARKRTDAKGNVSWYTIGSVQSVRAAIAYNNLLEQNPELKYKYSPIIQGSRIKLYIDIMGKPYAWNADSSQEPPEFSPKPDYDVMLEKWFLKPVRRILAPILGDIDISQLGNKIHYG